MERCVILVAAEERSRRREHVAAIDVSDVDNGYLVDGGIEVESYGCDRIGQRRKLDGKWAQV